MSTRIRVDPAVQCYDPYYQDGDGYQLKPFEHDPRCLFGWGPPSCDHRHGHGCVREVGHPGRCWDGIEYDAPKCSLRQRPKNWDSKLREECNQ